MLGHIYYGIGLIVLIFSISNIFNYSKIYNVRNWIRSFKKVSGNDPLNSDFRDSKDIKLISTYTFAITFEFIWLFFGLLTNSWYIYLMLILVIYLSGVIVSKVNVDFVQKNFGLVSYAFKSFIILMLIINHFHLHINWLELIN